MAGIWREEESSRFYKYLSKRATSDLKLLMEYLSLEELQHKKFLEGMYRKLFNEEPPHIEKLGSELELNWEVKSLEDLIAIAIEKEKESRNYYMDMFCKFEKVEDKERVLDLINFEIGHIKKLEGAIKQEG